MTPTKYHSSHFVLDGRDIPKKFCSHHQCQLTTTTTTRHGIALRRKEIYISLCVIVYIRWRNTQCLLYLRIVRGSVSAGGNKLCYGRKCALMKSPGQASPRSTSSQTPLSLSLSLSQLETLSRATPDAMRCSHSPPVAMGDILAHYRSRSQCLHHQPLTW